MILQQMCFERGTGQSLEWRPRLEGTRAAQDPERIAAHAIGYPQGESGPRHAAEKAAQFSAYPLESPVACLQSQTHIVIYP